jgi:hypothetical protein
VSGALRLYFVGVVESLLGPGWSAFELVTDGYFDEVLCFTDNWARADGVSNRPLEFAVTCEAGLWCVVRGFNSAVFDVGDHESVVSAFRRVCV